MDAFAHPYPPSNWTVDDIETALATAPETFPIPTYHDANQWSAIEHEPTLQPRLKEVFARANSAVEEPLTEVTATGYLEYFRHGTRTGYRDKERRRNLAALAIAECLRRDGLYLDRVWDYLWAVCEQSSWTLPAHLHRSDAEYCEGLPMPVEPEDHAVALRTTTIAKGLAEIVYVFDDLLHPAIRDRIHHEIDRRVFTPYLARDDFRWMEPPGNNWNAVCNGSILVAALHTCEDPARQANIITKAARNMRHYLNGFDADGCTPEGVKYWRYGFGYFVQAAVHLETRTDGEYSLFSPPIVEQIAAFPTRVELSPGRFPAFSDSSERYDLPPYLASELGHRYGIAGLVAHGEAALARKTSVDVFPMLMRDLFWTRDYVPDLEIEHARRDYFPGCGWWISRVAPNEADGLVVAAKAGHNGEPHNHNDCGAFVCHVRGESLVTDPGAGRYDAGYFGAERYEYLATRSVGHAVPIVNGVEQEAGSEYAARISVQESTPDTDLFEMDLTGAYPASAGIKSLQRQFRLDRSAGQMGALEVTDRAEFQSKADGELESILISYFPMDVDDGDLSIRGEYGDLDVSVSGATTSSIEQLTDHTLDDPLWRARFTAADTPTDETTIRLILTPKSA